ncbi:MAG: thymidine phosphorylase [Actinomycetaceae bacterium]|nr:thymidine phosphorylase [Actinomycetaceae bacterium]
MALTAIDIIRRKRDGGTLNDTEISWIISAYIKGQVADEQMSALLMAIFFTGMNDSEVHAWTSAMVASGKTMNLGKVSRPTVDKHSTGGVGDKISLPLAPLVASFGAAVPQLSGRGLGHTGGTLDKLESIPGWNCHLDSKQMGELLHDPGCYIAAPSTDVAPADKKLYALRDITCTVDSIPLIASSIMSKKIAEGTDALVLDVKCGSGAFMTKREDATSLARTMVQLGNDAGLKVSALITDMSSPLGNAVGNAVEVGESIEVLQGAGPDDVVELTCALAAEMLSLAGIDIDDPGKNLRNGKAYDTWVKMVQAQGGNPFAPLPHARHSDTMYANSHGTVSQVDALRVGLAAWRLGAGRTRKEDSVDPCAGVIVHARPGDNVTKGQPLFTLLSSSESGFDAARYELANSWQIAKESPNTPLPHTKTDASPSYSLPLIIDRVTS